MLPADSDQGVPEHLNEEGGHHAFPCEDRGEEIHVWGDIEGLAILPACKG